jgi:hypothetical protein
MAVDTAPHPEIETPPTLKSTTPGTDAVAVIVSIAPYVGVAALKARETVGVAWVIVKFEVEV